MMYILHQIAVWTILLFVMVPMMYIMIRFLIWQGSQLYYSIREMDLDSYGNDMRYLKSKRAKVDYGIKVGKKKTIRCNRFDALIRFHDMQFPANTLLGKIIDFRTKLSTYGTA